MWRTNYFYNYIDLSRTDNSIGVSHNYNTTTYLTDELNGFSSPGRYVHCFFIMVF